MHQLITIIFLIFISLTCCANLHVDAQHPLAGMDNTQTSPTQQKSVTQVSRYASVQNGATTAQINPLLAIVSLHFPLCVVTVGDAIKQVLAPTGYALIPHPDVAVLTTLQKPLPVSDRRLGPITIQHALVVLMGQDIFELQRDPLHRLVNFTVKPKIANALGVDND